MSRARSPRSAPEPRDPLGTLIVTGASRGIGAATARLAAEAGWAVAVNFRRDEAAAADVVAGIVAAGGRAAAVRADVWLLSSEASYTSGTFIDVTGGAV